MPPDVNDRYLLSDMFGDLYEKLFRQTMVEFTSNYIEGLEWCYLNTVLGENKVNLSWSYRFNISPLMFHTVSVLNMMKNKSSFPDMKYKDDQKYVNVLHYLLLTMPIKSKKLLPNKIQPLMYDDVNNEVHYYFPEKYSFVEHGFNDSADFIPVIPIPSINYIVTVINSNVEFTEDLILYEHKNNSNFGGNTEIFENKRKSLLKKQSKKKNFRRTRTRKRKRKVSKKIQYKTKLVKIEQEKQVPKKKNEKPQKKRQWVKKKT